MNSLFDIKCKNCGSPVSYDIVKGTYRCPHCGQISGIQEVREAASFRRLESRDRALRQSPGTFYGPSPWQELLVYSIDAASRGT